MIGRSGSVLHGEARSTWDGLGLEVLFCDLDSTMTMPGGRLFACSLKNSV
jgi:hypothetical protein